VVCDVCGGGGGKGTNVTGTGVILERDRGKEVPLDEH
jgi:hypothetical protein